MDDYESDYFDGDDEVDDVDDDDEGDYVIHDDDVSPVLVLFLVVM